jgi:hypothetical protein
MEVGLCDSRVPVLQLFLAVRALHYLALLTTFVSRAAVAAVKVQVMRVALVVLVLVVCVAQ